MRTIFFVPLLLCGCAGLELTPIQSSADEPSNVALYFRVSTNKGEPVPGLEADQFNIYEDDALVSTFESKQTILNPEVTASHYTLLLVDMSGSVAESDDTAAVADAAVAFTAQVSANNQVGVYAFDGSEELYTIAPFSADAGRVQSKVAGLATFAPEDPSTNLHGAVVAALAELDAGLAKAKHPLRFGTLVVFTDGTDRAARVSAEDMADALGETEYEVFAIGLGEEISEKDLDRIGKNGKAMATDRDSVTEAFEEVAARIEATTRSYYLLSYCTPARAGEHQVRVEAVTEIDGKEKKGDLSMQFDAEGFEPDCDPNREPKFDVTQGDALIEDDEAPAEKKKKGLFGGKAKAEASTDG